MVDPDAVALLDGDPVVADDFANDKVPDDDVGDFVQVEAATVDYSCAANADDRSSRACEIEVSGWNGRTNVLFPGTMRVVLLASVPET